MKIIERGWAGHFICANYCRFRRNTLIDAGDVKIVVSTVGQMEDRLNFYGYVPLGGDRYYETMAFHAKKDDTRYYDADVSKQVYFNSDWFINELDADGKANEMHEKVVTEIKNGLEKGYKYDDIQ